MAEVMRDGNGNHKSVPFQRLGSSEETTCIKEYGCVGEKATTVEKSGNEHDQFACSSGARGRNVVHS